MNLLSGFDLKCLIHILATVEQEDDTTCQQGLQSCQTRQKYVPLHSGRFQRRKIRRETINQIYDTCISERQSLF